MTIYLLALLVLTADGQMIGDANPAGFNESDCITAKVQLEKVLKQDKRVVGYALECVLVKPQPKGDPV